MGQCGCAHRALQELREVADTGRSLCCDRAQCEAEGGPTHGPSLSTPWAALAEQKMSECSFLVLQGLHCPSITCAHGMCALWWGQALRKRDLSSTAGHCPALGHSRALETPLQPNPASPQSLLRAVWSLPSRCSSVLPSAEALVCGGGGEPTFWFS